jgi:type IV pilus assembly protein PilZ
MSEHPPDRRSELRAPIELKVEYKRLNSFFADYTRNISRGGTFIRTSKPLDIGTEFVFKLVVPNMEKPLALRGKVQWTVSPENATDEQPAGMGIGFVYRNESEREKIESLVENLMVDSLGQVIYDKLMKRRDMLT